jgi:hypothetical protein
VEEVRGASGSGLTFYRAATGLQGGGERRCNGLSYGGIVNGDFKHL